MFQGENPIARENVPLGAFKIEGLPPKPAGALEVEVHFDFDINGILTVTATEKRQRATELSGWSTMPPPDACLAMTSTRPGKIFYLPV